MNADKLRDACQTAYYTFGKLKSNEHTEIMSKLEFCIGSYNFDNNPAGLVEYGEKALDILKSVKSKSPRKVSKKVIDSLEKSLQN